MQTIEDMKTENGLPGAGDEAEDEMEEMPGAEDEDDGDQMTDSKDVEKAINKFADEKMMETDFNQMIEKNKLKSLDDFDSYARGHHLNMKNMQVVVQMKILNTGSHFSEDKFNLAVVYVVLTVIFIAMAILNYQKYKEDRERFEEEDSPLSFTFGSLNLIAMHCMLKCVHNFYYA